MKVFNYILFFLGISFFGFTQNVTILGFAPDYKGKEISLFTYSDYISNVEIPVASMMVDDSSRFSFTIQTDGIKRMLVRTGKQKAVMYVEPNKLYKIYFPKRDSVRFPNPNTEQEVDISFLVTDTTEINSRIIDFNEKFEKFWEQNYQFFVKSHARYKLDTFQLKTEKYYDKVKDPYFQNFLKYSFASFDYNAFSSRKDIASKYIVGKPVLYDNYEYMNLFNEFFKHYLIRSATANQSNAMTIQINEKMDHEACLRILKVDNTLQNDTLRELVLIKVLYDEYYAENSKQKNIVKILDNIGSNSKIAKHKLIAANALQSFSKLKPGAQAPEFLLVDRNKKPVGLSDLKGKYVYINFWSGKYTSSLEEMKLIPELKKRYGSKIVFVSISFDKTPNEMNKYIELLAKNKKIKYDWIFLHAVDQQKIIDDYELKTIPTYFFIDQQGKLIQSPAMQPQYMNAIFGELLRDKNWNPNLIPDNH